MRTHLPYPWRGTSACAKPEWTRPTPGGTMDHNGLKGARMAASSTARVLVVAHKTAATPALMNAVRERAARGPPSFHLLVPNPHHPALRHPSEMTHPNVTEGEQVLALALPLIE